MINYDYIPDAFVVEGPGSRRTSRALKTNNSIDHRRIKLENLIEIDAEGFRDVVDTNLTGYFLVAKAFVPMMIEKKEGRIVNISTSLSTMRMSNMTPYGPSRAASEALSEIMSVELAEYGIDVNILLPGGAAETNLFTQKALIDFKNKKLPLLDADIMAEPILFLASHTSKRNDRRKNHR